MSLENKISLSVSSESMKKISDAIHVIQGELPFLLNLSVDERKSLLKMGDKTVAFVHKAFEYANQNPQTLPAFVSLPEFEKDVQMVDSLTKVLYPLEQLVEKLDDTCKIAGSEAYSAALVYYKSVKSAANAGVPGMKGIVDDLSVRFGSKSGSHNAQDLNKN